MINQQPPVTSSAGNIFQQYWKKYPQAFVLLALTLVLSLLMMTNPSEHHSHHHQEEQTRRKFSDEIVSSDYDKGIYKIAIISDMDEDSKVNGEAKWKAHLRTGALIRNQQTKKYKIVWEEEITLGSKYAEGTKHAQSRGMELSTLVKFNDLLYACDDRTGILYQIEGEKVIPRQILTDGDGNSGKGFKCEWATVNSGFLFIGSMGKEYTNNEGKIVSKNPQYVKVLDANLHVQSLDWSNNYNKVRAHTGHKHPGYLLHEAVVWHPFDKRWYFLPRRASKEAYNDQLDQRRGTNLLIAADEEFEDIKFVEVGTLNPERGFSAFRFIPGHNTEIVALKTKEVGDDVESYITVIDVKTNTILLPETKIDNVKFEGIELV